MPPVDPRFGDFMRALITADSDLVSDDRFGYRTAFIEAFGTRGIPAEGVRALSEESLRWQTLLPEVQPRGLGDFIRRSLDLSWDVRGDRRAAWQGARANAGALHEWLSDPANLTQENATALGLDRSPARTGEFDGYGDRRDRHKLPQFEVHSVRPARRATSDGDMRTDIIAVITQRRRLPGSDHEPFYFRGGCTLVLDRREGLPPVRYCITVPVFSDDRADSASTGRIHAWSAKPLLWEPGPGTIRDAASVLLVGEDTPWRKVQRNARSSPGRPDRPPGRRGPVEPRV